jgi:hypothetical protein
MLLNDWRQPFHYGTTIKSHSIDKSVIHFLLLISIGHAPLFLIWICCSLYSIINIKMNEQKIHPCAQKHIIQIYRITQCICHTWRFAHPWKKNERRKENKKQIIKATSLLAKQTSKAYVTLQGYDKIMNTEEPNIHLFLIPKHFPYMQNVECTKSYSKGCKLSLQLLESFYIHK